MTHPGDTTGSKNALERWDQWGLAIACLVAVCGSVIAALFGISAAWQMPFLFTAVYAILRHVAPMADSRRELENLRAEVKLLRQDFDHVNTSRVEHYPDSTSFYRALSNHLIHRHPRHLDTWYMRLETPDDFSTSTPAFADYFNAALDFARSGGSVRRLFCSGSSRSYSAWTTRHREETRDLGSYTVREVTWPIRADLLSMAIVDTDAVFLAFTDGDRVQGMRLEDGEAASYFKSYFNRHWENAREVRRA